MASLHDRDGRQAHHLSETLGDLWKPVHFKPQRLPVREVLEARLELCIRMASAQRGSATDWTRRWLDRVNGWPRRRVRELDTALAAAERDLAALQAQHAGLLKAAAEQEHELESRRREIEAELASLSPSLRSEKRARADAFAELKAAERTQLRGARGVDPAADSALHEIHRQMRALSAALGADPTPARRRQPELQAELQEIAKEAAALANRAHDAERRIADAEQRVGRCRERVGDPWSDDPPPFVHIGEYSNSLPDGLDSIGWGKVWDDETYRFLATHGGLWSIRHRYEPWAHSLVGPTWVVQDLLIALAELLVAGRSDWALAGRVAHFGESRVGARERALAVGFSLPSPISGSPAEAVRFRQEHEEELQSLRDCVEGQINVGDVADLRDAIADVRHLIAEPVAEVKRALELDERLGCKAITLATLREVPSGMKGLTAGSLATLLASPIVGERLTTPGVLGAAIGGTALVAARLGATTWRAASERRGLERGVLAGPYRYVYEVGRQFGLASATAPRGG